MGNKEATCCLDCHFALEERECLRYLPPHLRQQLLREHKVLREAGFPRGPTLAHAEREMVWFRQCGVPERVLRQIQMDHVDFEKKSRSNPEEEVIPVTSEPMPSYEAVCDLYKGEPDALWKVGLGYATRSAFIAAGIYLAGERDLGKVALYSLAGSAAVEGFVIGYVFYESGKLQYSPKLL